MFESPTNLSLGLITGILFGFLLQKGRVAKYEVILGQLLLRDWTVLKTMLTAIVVGSLGVQVLIALELATLHVRPFALAGLLIGGACFGTGMAILGYCPGTTVAACGEGKRDAMVGVLGMLCGAGAYVLAYGPMQHLIAALGDRGKITLPDLSGVHPLLWTLMPLALLVVIAVASPRMWPPADKAAVSGENRAVASH